MQLEDYNENAIQLEKFDTRFKKTMLMEEERWDYKLLGDKALVFLSVTNTWHTDTHTQWNFSKYLLWKTEFVMIKSNS